MQFHYFPTPEATNTLSTGELRSRFLISDLFKPGALTIHYTDLDRMIVGAALPESTSLALPVAKETGTSVPWVGFPVGYAVSGVLYTVFGYFAMLLSQ